MELLFEDAANLPEDFYEIEEKHVNIEKLKEKLTFVHEKIHLESFWIQSEVLYFEFVCFPI